MNSASFDLLTGSMQNEVNYYALVVGGLDLLFRGSLLTQANTHAGKTYVYYREYPSWIEGISACYVLDIPYVFNDNTNSLVAMNYNQALASQIQDMWVNFAKTGSQSTVSVTWLEYDSAAMATMIINDPLAVRNGNLAEEYASVQLYMTELTRLVKTLLLHR